MLFEDASLVSGSKLLRSVFTQLNLFGLVGQMKTLEGIAASCKLKQGRMEGKMWGLMGSLLMIYPLLLFLSRKRQFSKKSPVFVSLELSTADVTRCDHVTKTTHLTFTTCG